MSHRTLRIPCCHGVKLPDGGRKPEGMQQGDSTIEIFGNGLIAGCGEMHLAEPLGWLCRSHVTGRRCPGTANYCADADTDEHF